MYRIKKAATLPLSRFGLSLLSCFERDYIIVRLSGYISYGDYLVRVLRRRTADPLLRNVFLVPFGGCLDSC